MKSCKSFHSGNPDSDSMRTIADPACGTGGFFLAAYDFIVEHHEDLDREQKKFLKLNTFYCNEIVAGTRRLALMNLFLHNFGDIDPAVGGTGSFISGTDA